MKRIWIIIAVILIVLVAVFFALGLFPGRPPAKKSENTEVNSPNLEQDIASVENSGDTIDTVLLPKLNKPALLQGLKFPDEPVSSNNITKDDLSKWNLILVNSKSPLNRAFTVDLVETVDGYMVDVRIYEALETMIADASKDGVILTICSAYRSVATQNELLEKKAQSLVVSGIDTDLAYYKASQYISNPGESEHHTGLAVDLITPGTTTLDDKFEKTEAFKWLSENAHRYGFILRYPKGKEDITGIYYEPWHYRFVGKEHAAAIKESGLCLEEYLSTAE